MSSMKSVCFKIDEDAPSLRPFILMRDCVIPSIRERAGELGGMYSPVMGRPETDPVLLLGVTALQIMMNLPDRACAEACLYDARWRTALGDEIPAFHPTTLVKFRNRITSHGKSKLALESCLAADAGAVINPHDPDVQWSTKKLADKKGWHGYKVQVCETAEEGTCVRGEPTQAVITAAHVQPAITSDHGSVPAVLAEHQSAVGAGCPPPAEVFVDAGYVSAPALLGAEAAGYALTGPMPAPPNSRLRFSSDSFIVDIPGRAAVCPADHASSECSRIDDAKYARYGARYYFAWPRKICAACPLRGRCLSKKNKLAHRTLEVNEHHMTVQARRNLCKTQDYQDHMHRRSAIEGSHSELVRGYGLRKCRYRGRLKTDLQAQFTATACNLRRWARRLCWEEREMA